MVATLLLDPTMAKKAPGAKRGRKPKEHGPAGLIRVRKDLVEMLNEICTVDKLDIPELIEESPLRHWVVARYARAARTMAERAKAAESAAEPRSTKSGE